MAVAETLVLPNQPAVGGAVTFVPLGGDGFSAPQAAYALSEMKQTGDVSGGSVSFFIQMDDRFCSLVSYVTFKIAQASAADADARLAVAAKSGGTQIPLAINQELHHAGALVVNVNNVGATWSVPALILPGAGQSGQIVAQFKNVDDDDFFVSALVYLFNIRVREMTPMGPLLWARGAT